MKSGFVFFISSLLFLSCSTRLNLNKQTENEELINKVSNVIQNNSSYPRIPSEIMFPKSLDKKGEIQYVGTEDWTSGFYPGVLWFMYALTGKDKWKEEATIYTGLLEGEKTNAGDPGLGLKMMTSFGQGIRLGDTGEYRNILIQAARTLISAFDEKSGCLGNPVSGSGNYGYLVDIRNMMSLELLFQATRETGEPVFYNIAVKHALTTMENQFRNDYSVYARVNYDTLTGTVTERLNRCGFPAETNCPEDQAWALYGFTMVYRETQNPVFLKHAEKIADYILKQPGMTEGNINSGNSNISNGTGLFYNAASAAVTADALFDLGRLSANREIYLRTAGNLMETLSSGRFLASPDENKGFLLKHSVRQKPSDNESGVSVIYADYYFLEALKRKIEIENSINN